MHPDERRSPEHVAAQRVAELTADPGLFLTRFEGLHVRRARDTERIEELSGQVKAFKKVATERDRLKKRLVEAEAGLSETGARNAELEAQVSAFRKVATERDRLRKQLAQEQEDSTARREEAQSALSAAEQHIADLGAQVKAFRKVATERDRLRKKLTALQQDLERRLGSAHGALDAYRSENAQLKEDLKRVRQSRSMRVGRAILSPATALKRVFGGTGSGAQPLVIEGRPVSSESEPTPLKAVEPGAVAHVDSSKEGEQK